MTKINELMVRAMAWAETRKSEDGQGLAEYGLILALVAVVCILALTALGDGIVAKLGEVTAGLA